MAKTEQRLTLHLDKGDVVIKLRSDLAPKHVEQIRQLAKDGAYDDVAFHRVIPGFMAQGGDVQYGKSRDYPQNFNKGLVGTGGSSMPNIPAEFSDVSHKRGTVSMARSMDPGSANSQFFICFNDAPWLNGQYTIWGEVESGMDVVDTINKGSADDNGSVAQPDYIVRTTVTD